MQTKEQKKSAGHIALSIVGIVLCVILVPMLIINCTLIVKSVVNPDKVPGMFGVTPMIVLTDSMHPTIESGDLIFCRVTQPEDVKKGDIIAFFDPASEGQAVVTHRVDHLSKEEGTLLFYTKGDANNAVDTKPVPASSLVGVYQTRVAGAGQIALFMQSTPGFVICVVLPIGLFLLYDVIRRRAYERANATDTEALRAELEALKAQKAEETKDTAEE